MASIHKKEGSEYWHCSFKLPDGSWTLRSTKESDAKIAQRVCLAYEASSEQAVKGALVESQARRVIGDIAEMANGEPLVTETIAEFLNGWAQAKSLSRAAGTAVRYQEIATELTAFLGPKSKRPIGNLTKTDIQNYRDGLLKRGLKASTANLILKALRSALNGAKRQGHIAHNQAEAVDTLPIDALEKEVFTPEQIKQLLTVADDEWEGVILYGYCTGARLRNCADANWDQIDWAKRCLKFKPVKQKKTSPTKTLLVPIHSDLWRYLKRRHRVGLSGSIFPNLSKKKTGGKTGLSLTFRDMMVEAGIKFTAQEKTGDGRRVYSLGFHSLRHSFNSALANANVSQELRQRLIGQASEEVNTRYTHLEVETFRSAISKLPSVNSVSKRKRSSAHGAGLK